MGGNHQLARLKSEITTHFTTHFLSPELTACWGQRLWRSVSEELGWTFATSLGGGGEVNGEVRTLFGSLNPKEAKTFHTESWGICFPYITRIHTAYVGGGVPQVFFIFTPTYLGRFDPI